MTRHEASDQSGHAGTPRTCRVCSSSYVHEEHPSALGICERCSYRVLTVLLVIMVIVSYIAWFGIL